MKKMLLTVAGFDPSGGAGLILDLQVFRSLGFQGTAVVTALTSQNSQKVFEVRPLPAPFILSQYRVLKKDFTWEGLKIGLVGHRSLFPAIREILEDQADRPRVIDPVFRSSSGTWFLERGDIPVFLKTISGQATVITPNIPEASLITGIKIRSVEDMERAAQRIYEMTGIACSLKGGHGRGKIFDLLYTGKIIRLVERERLPVRVHGTGCLFSASLLSYLALLNDLERAWLASLRFTRRAIKKAFVPRRGRAIFSF